MFTGSFVRDGWSVRRFCPTTMSGDDDLVRCVCSFDGLRRDQASFSVQGSRPGRLVSDSSSRPMDSLPVRAVSDGQERWSGPVWMLLRYSCRNPVTRKAGRGTAELVRKGRPAATKKISPNRRCWKVIIRPKCALLWGRIHQVKRMLAAVGIRGWPAMGTLRRHPAG